MIVVKLMGGLGNQMFQYAAARSLSLRLRTALKLDLSFLEGEQTGNTPRAFELDRFNISAEKASPREISQVSGRQRSLCDRFRDCYFRPSIKGRLFREKQFNVDPAFFLLPDQVYLEGYWQSEQYFAQFCQTIREEFTLKAPLAGRCLELAEEIQSVNAVSVHVRRGDYVSDPVTRAAHYVCDLDYYRRAEETLLKSVSVPHCFVFSDDPDWVAAHLKLRSPTRFASHSEGLAHEDLRLMSLCRHHITANSSFSWWGAWLNCSPEKIVCAPEKWFNGMQADTCDLIPRSWRKIK
jgi:hypothetical protein